MLCFLEMASAGFGDRLRGIAWLLHLAHLHGDTVLRYNDDGMSDDQEWRHQCFPGRMTDLVRFEGLSFEYQPLPFPKADHYYVTDSVIDHRRQTRPGFPHMHRLRPRDPGVTERLREIGIDPQCLGFHVRWTDDHNPGHLRTHEPPSRIALRNLARLARRMGTRRVFLASDNAASLQRWHQILESAGYDVLGNRPAYDHDKLRQTGNFDMMVDFFGLASCGRLVRVVPSEFSRFAAWVAGRRLKYRQLL